MSWEVKSSKLNVFASPILIYFNHFIAMGHINVMIIVYFSKRPIYRSNFTIRANIRLQMWRVTYWFVLYFIDIYIYKYEKNYTDLRKLLNLRATILHLYNGKKKNYFKFGLRQIMDIYRRHTQDWWFVFQVTASSLYETKHETKIVLK